MCEELDNESNGGFQPLLSVHAYVYVFLLLLSYFLSALPYLPYLYVCSYVSDLTAKTTILQNDYIVFSIYAIAVKMLNFFETKRQK